MLQYLKVDGNFNHIYSLKEIQIFSLTNLLFKLLVFLSIFKSD